MQLLRIFFTKTGEAAYISHLDLQRVMARALRISGLPVWYSQGFNPHIYMRFSLPLPLLHESVCESVDCKTESETQDFSAFVAPLSAALPRGIEARRIAMPVHGAESIARATYSMAYSCANTEALIAATAAYNAAQTAMVLRKTKRSEQEVDLKAVLPHIALQGDVPCGAPCAAWTCGEIPDSALPRVGEGGIAFSLPAGSVNHYSPALLARYFEENGGLPAEQAQIMRLAVYTQAGEVFR